MNKLVKAALFLAASAVPLASMAMPEAYIEGVHYKATPTRLATSDDTKVEVVEVFSYACPHCFHFEPLVEKWAAALPDNVKFVRVPAIFRESWLQLAKLYYTAEATGDLERLHPLIFKAIHVDKKRLNTEAQILDFVADQGIDRDAFEKMMGSMTVQAKVKKALAISQQSGITGVPSMIVNGQYSTDAPMAGSMEEMLKTVDFLVQKQSK